MVHAKHTSKLVTRHGHNYFTKSVTWRSIITQCEHNHTIWPHRHPILSLSPRLIIANMNIPTWSDFVSTRSHHCHSIWSVTRFEVTRSNLTDLWCDQAVTQSDHSQLIWSVTRSEFTDIRSDQLPNPIIADLNNQPVWLHRQPIWSQLPDLIIADLNSDPIWLQRLPLWSDTQSDHAVIPSDHWTVQIHPLTSHPVWPLDSTDTPFNQSSRLTTGQCRYTL